jgi:phospho-N-acetylmuramoyl-pentapeptide-transferase
MKIDAITILIPAVLAFLIAMLVAKSFIKFLTKHTLWKKKSVTTALGGFVATITNKIHNDDNKKTPRLGGVLIWGSTFACALILWMLAEYHFLPSKLDFVSRNQTWLIIFGMVSTGILGAIDDISSCGKNVPFIGNKGLSFKYRILVVFLLSLFVAYWFYFKLYFINIFIPFFGIIFIGSLIIPLIIFVFILMSTVSVVDGIDGLSGGLFAIAFASFGIIAVAQGQIDIAAFCFAVVGSIVAFLWYNIPPAQFYNSETGMLSLSTTLTLVALMTNQIFTLFIISIALLSAPASGFIQIMSKKFRGKKVFLVAPIHHHFQANGMKAETVTMRYWLFATICAFIAVVFALAGSI